MYNLLQITVFVIFLVLGVLRLQDKDFPLLIIINSGSFVVSILFVLYTAIDKINRRKSITTLQKKRVDHLQAQIVFVSTFGSGLLIYLSYHGLISSNAADFLSIIAFGMSCANDVLSNALIYKVCKDTV